MLKKPSPRLSCTIRDVLHHTARLLLRPLGIIDWRLGADVAKRTPSILLLADRLGREHGRIRFLDGLLPPPPAPRRPDIARLLASDFAAAWLGHATLLLRIGGMTILTDPVFSPRIGVGLLFATIGPRRHQQPALRIDELPHIDLILSSHAHFDHLDRPSLWRLARRFRDTPVIAAAGTGDLFADLGFRDLRELDWEESTRVGGVSVRAVPIRHWGPRVFYDNWRGFNAYLVEATKRRSDEATKGPRVTAFASRATASPAREAVPDNSAASDPSVASSLRRSVASSHRILFGGDTAMTDTFTGLGPVDLMAIGISAYAPYIAAHCNPEQAWEMTRMAGARHILPMHHSTFRLSHEPMHEPLERLLAAAGEEGHRIVIRRVGEMWVKGWQG